MKNVVIAGIGMTPFAHTPGLGIRALAVSAAEEALADSGLSADAVEQLFFGNAVASTVTQQDMVKGQVAFRGSSLDGLPVINVENACASGSSAFNLAVKMVAGGVADVILVVGTEQLTSPDKTRSFKALRGATDIFEIGEAGPDEDWTKSILMKFYAEEGAAFLRRTPVTREDFAQVSVKNRHHASLNPLAQFRKEQTVDDVMNARLIADPLTLTMCSPMSDGAAAVVVCSEEYATANVTGPVVRVLGTEVRGTRRQAPVVEAAQAVYAATGLSVADMHVIELHDAAAPAELIQYGQIGLAEPGEEYRLIRGGDTALGGRVPVNTSGGLMSRGHALGATGVAQLVELSTQLRGEAGARQVNNATRAMAVNTGGWFAGDYAVAVATILEREQ
ncbi:thiolase family protein [soil metagenome]